ncbi:MAG: c-type cytochrome biogenesis protein CcmF, partial [Gammaproteobacteria bacterium]|nr:c-type cytochrome biogenesis protein CcmF [Gammaproteobacteria bacterium]
ETDQRIVAGETVTVADYTIRMGEVKPVEGPNYSALRAEMVVTRAGKPVATLYPEKRLYRVQQSPMTEADIDDGWGRHVFIALGDQLEQNVWSVRIQYKPLIRFIWFGAFVMALGGLLAVTDARYRLKKTAKDIDGAAASSAASLPS